MYFQHADLTSGYYAPLEISLYLADPRICLQSNKETAVGVNYSIKAPRLCIDELVLTPQYVAAFEGALVQRSSSNGVQMSFDTYSVFSNTIDFSTTCSTTFWLRQPVRYLRGMYWGAVYADYLSNVTGHADYGGNYNGVGDAFCFSRGVMHRTKDLLEGGAAIEKNPLFKSAGKGIRGWQVTVGSKSYRKIDATASPDFDGPGAAISTPGMDGADPAVVAAQNNYLEDDVMFYKAIGRYGEPGVGTDEFRPEVKKYKSAQTGLDFDNCPDNSVLSCETTLANNDVRLELFVAKGTNESAGLTKQNYRVYTIFHYQGAMSLFPGNECRLLIV